MGMLDGKHGNLSCFKYVFAFMSQDFFCESVYFLTE